MSECAPDAGQRAGKESAYAASFVTVRPGAFERPSVFDFLFTLISLFAGTPAVPTDPAPDNAIRIVLPPLAKVPDTQRSRVVPVAIANQEMAEIDCLASAVHYEARGEPKEGQVAVVEVIMTRKASQSWPDTACKVVAQRKQFSFVKKGRIPAAPDDCRREHEEIVRQVLSGGLRSSVKGAQWFHADYVSPHWSKSYRRAGAIGQHIFYRI